VQHRTLKSSEITMSSAPRYPKDHCLEGSYASPACPSDKISIKAKRRMKHLWKDDIRTAR
jgi:hypothetical protein